MASAHDQLVPILRWLGASDLLARAESEHKARLVTLDTIGCLLAGLRAEPVRALAAALEASDPGAVRLPGVASLSVSAAAELGAIAATWDEACEGLARAHGRPGVAVIAAMFALARDHTLGALLSSIVAGYEVGARLGEWLRVRPGMHVDAGWPAFGVATAALRLARGSAETMLDALEILACQVPFGLYASARAGATARNTYLGQAARLGLASARAATAGITAPTDALADYASLALGLEARAARLAPVGEFLLLETYLKPFAAVRHVHYAAAAAIALAPRLLTRLARVEAIELRTYAEAITYCGNRAPRTPLAAQFSLSFGTAAGLRFGALGPQVYREPLWSEAGLRALEARVLIETDAVLTANARRGATVRVRVDGETLESQVERVKGDPDDPMSAAECRAKFIDYAAATIGRERAERFATVMLEAPTDQRVDSLWGELGD